MNYESYIEKLVRGKGVGMVNWPAGVDFKRMSLQSAIGPLQTLLDSLKSGTTRWKKLTARETEQLIAQYEEMVRNGEVAGKKKSRSTATRKAKKTAIVEEEEGGDNNEEEGATTTTRRREATTTRRRRRRHRAQGSPLQRGSAPPRLQSGVRCLGRHQGRDRRARGRWERRGRGSSSLLARWRHATTMMAVTRGSRLHLLVQPSASVWHATTTTAVPRRIRPRLLVQPSASARHPRLSHA
jgi:hypothetical protein